MSNLTIGQRKERSNGAVCLLVNERTSFSPTFGLCGVLLPVGSRHVKAQGSACQGLRGADKMKWKSDFPSALFLRQTDPLCIY